MSGFAGVFKDWFTGKTGESFELGRALWALACLAMIVYQGIAIWFKGQDFHPIDFGTGFAAILAAGGIGIAAKDRGGIAPQPAPKVSVAGDATVDVK